MEVSPEAAPVVSMLTEENPEILKAELDILTQPITRDYVDVAYFAIKNVQDQCATDYATACSQTPTMENFVSIDVSLPSARRSLVVGKMVYNGEKIEKTHHIFSPFVAPFSTAYDAYIAKRPVTADGYGGARISHQVMTDTAVGKQGLNLGHGPVVVGPAVPLPSPTAASKLSSTPALSDGAIFIGDPVPIGSTAPSKAQSEVADRFFSLRGGIASRVTASRRLSDHHDKDAEEVDHDHDHRDHDHHDHDHRDHDHHDHHDGPPRPGSLPGPSVPPRPESPPCDRIPDDFYSGSLGYGATGDMCMYTKLESLSAPCQDAIGDLYDLRAKFLEDTDRGHGWGHDWYHRHPPPHAWLVLPLLAAACLVAFMVSKRRRWGKRKEVKTILRAISGDPELKALVESKAGVAIPEMRFDGSDGASRFRGDGVGARVLRVMAGVLATFASSALIAWSSLGITGHILHAISEKGNELDGEDRPQLPPWPVAIAILGIVTVAEVALFILFVRGVRRVFGGPDADRARNEEDRREEFSYSALSGGDDDRGGMLAQPGVILYSHPQTTSEDQRNAPAVFLPLAANPVAPIRMI